MYCKHTKPCDDAVRSGICCIEHFIRQEIHATIHNQLHSLRQALLGDQSRGNNVDVWDLQTTLFHAVSSGCGILDDISRCLLVKTGFGYWKMKSLELCLAYPAELLLPCFKKHTTQIKDILVAFSKGAALEFVFSKKQRVDNLCIQSRWA